MILSNKELKEKEPVAMDHSKQVAAMHYDKSGAKSTVEVKNWMSQMNSEKPLPIDITANNEALKKERRERQEESNVMAREVAAAGVAEAKKHMGRRTHNSQCKMTPEEVVVVVRALKSEPEKKTSQIFCPPKRIPGEKDFHRGFYDLLDSTDLAEETREKLAEVEASIFKDEVGSVSFSLLALVIPHAQVASKATWPADPTEKDHKDADEKIGRAIWRSLENKFKEDKSWAELIVRNRRT